MRASSLARLGPDSWGGVTAGSAVRRDSGAAGWQAVALAVTDRRACGVIAIDD